MECTLAANFDESSKQIANDRLKNDYGWTDEMIEMRQKINEMTAEHPIYSIHTGVPTDLMNILDSGDQGIRAPFYGHDWPTVREALAPAADLLIEEFNASLDAME